MKKLLLLILLLVSINSYSQLTIMIDSTDRSPVAAGDTVTFYLHATGTAWPLTPNARLFIEIDIVPVIDTPYSAIDVSSVMAWKAVMPSYVVWPTAIVRVINSSNYFIYDVYYLDINTGIHTPKFSKAIESVIYYSLQGIEIQPQSGEIVLELIRFRDGTVSKRKLFYVQ